MNYVIAEIDLVLVFKCNGVTVLVTGRTEQIGLTKSTAESCLRTICDMSVTFRIF